MMRSMLIRSLLVLVVAFGAVSMGCDGGTKCTSANCGGGGADAGGGGADAGGGGAGGN